MAQTIKDIHQLSFQLNNMSDMLLHSMPVLLSRDDVIVVTTVLFPLFVLE